MSVFLDLIERLRDTSAQISRLEATVSEHPDELGLLINLRSLQKRMRVLEEHFDALTQEQQLDVCDYRLMAGSEGRYPISAVGAALTSFQDMVTAFFDAFRTGPKIRARIAPDIAEMASLDLAYSYSGSLGFALTVPNERLLLVESDLDRAIGSAFAVVSAEDTTAIAELAREVGVASIRRTYAWAKHHAQYGLSADIQWKRGSEVRNRVVVNSESLLALTDLIEKTSETETVRSTLNGLLVGLDVTLGSFHFQPQEGEDIRGKLAEDFSYLPSIPIPSAMTVDVVKRTKLHYSIEKEEVTWTLVAARPLHALPLPPTG